MKPLQNIAPQQRPINHFWTSGSEIKSFFFCRYLYNRYKHLNVTRKLKENSQCSHRVNDHFTVIRGLEEIPKYGTLKSEFISFSYYQTHSEPRQLFKLDYG